MLVIREAQMRVFQAKRDDVFAAWAADHLRRTCPEATSDFDDTELRRRALVGLGRARSAGFGNAAQVAEYLVLMFRWAPNFDDHPEVKHALARDVPRELVLLTLTDAVGEAVRAEVRARRDDRVWQGA
jgi:hypothetical protein